MVCLVIAEDSRLIVTSVEETLICRMEMLLHNLRCSVFNKCASPR